MTHVRLGSPGNPRAIKAVGFDLGDTLVEYEGLPLSWEQHYPDALRELAAALGIAPRGEQLEAACAILRNFNTRLTPREHEVTFASILVPLANALGASAPGDELGAAKAFFRVFRRRLRCFPETSAALHQLRHAGLPLGIFTDVPYGMPRELVLEDVTLAGLSGVCDVLLTSRDTGCRKPAAATLQRLAAAMGCDARELAYVGNERKDIVAAQAAGALGILIDRTDERPAWGQDWTIRSLAEMTPNRPDDSVAPR